MDTNKAAYWIALGVLVLGLNSEYRNGRFVALHRVANRAGSVLCRISTRAEQTLAVANLLTSHEGFTADNLLASADGAEMARDQAELLQEQARAGLSASATEFVIRSAIRFVTRFEPKPM